MRLTKNTDYGLRVLLYAAARPAQRVSTEEISTAFGISHHHLGKVVQKLGRFGWLDLKRGRGGGLMLARDPADIRLGDVVRSTEPDLHLVECFDAARNTCPITAVCGLIAPLREARTAFLTTLDGYTLADILPEEQRPALIQLLGG